MALHDVKRARIGHFGHPIEHMLDMQTDQTALTAAFGCHIVQTEADDLLRCERQVSDAETEAKSAEILELFDTPDPGADPAHPQAHRRGSAPRRAGRRGARPVRRDAQSRRPGLLLRRRTGQSVAQHRHQSDRRQLSAHRGRIPHVRRIRSQDLHRHAADGPPRISAAASPNSTRSTSAKASSWWATMVRTTSTSPTASRSSAAW